MSARVGEVQFCAGCGRAGFAADTTAGEVVVLGRVVWTVPSGSLVLLSGLADGTETDRLFCCECASSLSKKSEVCGDCI